MSEKGFDGQYGGSGEYLGSKAEQKRSAIEDSASQLSNEERAIVQAEGQISPDMLERFQGARIEYSSLETFKGIKDPLEAISYFESLDDLNQVLLAFAINPNIGKQLEEQLEEQLKLKEEGNQRGSYLFEELHKRVSAVKGQLFRRTVESYPVGRQIDRVEARMQQLQQRDDFYPVPPTSDKVLKSTVAILQSAQFKSTGKDILAMNLSRDVFVGDDVRREKSQLIPFAHVDATASFLAGNIMSASEYDAYVWLSKTWHHNNKSMDWQNLITEMRPDVDGSAPEIEMSPLEMRFRLASLWEEDLDEYYSQIDIILDELSLEDVQTAWRLHEAGASPEVIWGKYIGRMALGHEVSSELASQIGELGEVNLMKDFIVLHQKMGLEVKEELLPRLLWKFVHEKYNYTEAIKREYTLEQIFDYPFIASGGVGSIEEPFPADKKKFKDGVREKWLSKHSLSHPLDWSHRHLGKIIHVRLSAGIDRSLHDASHWLDQFNPPETTVDGSQLWSSALEVEFLAGLMQIPVEVQGALGEEKNVLDQKLKRYTKYQEFFSSHATDIVHEALLALYAKQAKGTEHISIEDLRTEALRLAEARVSDHKVRQEEIEKQVNKVLEQIGAVAEFQPVSKLVGELKTLSQARIAFANDAQKWVETNATTPRELLLYAWNNRRLALADGCRDNPRAIKQWADVEGLKETFKTMEDAKTLPENISREDLVAYAPWFSEMLRHYSAQQAIEAVSEIKENFNPEAKIPPARIDIGQGWSGEVLKKDDPRGATIGADTGCCMTLDGASESCIMAGYEQPECGFFVLTRHGEVVAQSFLYVNEEKAPGVIVADNIEANKGRDFGEVVKRYDAFFQKYIVEQLKDQEKGKVFTEVHIGTGYTDVNLADLAVATVVPMEDSEVYTDAKQQRLLFKFSEDELKKMREELERS